MMPFIEKQIVVDEAHQPVAVIINYKDWQKIEALLQQSEPDKNTQPTVDSSEALRAYAGSITLTVDPLDYQRETRDAWL